MKQPTFGTASLIALFLLSFLSLFANASSVYGSHKLTAYVVDWEIPSDIQWSKLDHIVYAFAEPSSDGDLTGFTASQLKSVVSEAHKEKKGVSLSVGGWDGSKYFSTLVRTSSSRSSFVSKLVDIVEKYDLNGLNLDWEYPNDPKGVACNYKDSDDTENFLKLIQLLREKLDDKFKSERKIITAAVFTEPFLNNKREVSTSLPGWNSAIDYIYLMVYDVNANEQAETNSNAPLYSNGKGYPSSVQISVEEWNKAGISLDKLVVGVPFYGYTIGTKKAMSSSTGISVPLNPSQIKGDEYDTKSADPCKGAKAEYSGEYEWRSVVSEGIEDNKNGWKSYFDSKTYTPWAYHSSNHQFLSYDNAKSLEGKAEYAKDHKLGGVMIWSLEMDDSKHTLLNSLQTIRD